MICIKCFDEYDQEEADNLEQRWTWITYMHRLFWGRTRMKYTKNTMITMLKDKVIRLESKDTTRARIGIALLVLDNESLKSITTVYGYNLEERLKWC